MENEAFENNETDFDTSLDRQTSEVDLEVGGNVGANNINDGDAEGILSNDDRGELPLLPYRNRSQGMTLECSESLLHRKLPSDLEKVNFFMS